MDALLNRLEIIIANHPIALTKKQREWDREIRRKARTIHAPTVARVEWLAGQVARFEDRLREFRVSRVICQLRPEIMPVAATTGDPYDELLALNTRLDKMYTAYGDRRWNQTGRRPIRLRDLGRSRRSREVHPKYREWFSEIRSDIKRAASIAPAPPSTAVASIQAEIDRLELHVFGEFQSVGQT